MVQKRLYVGGLVDGVQEDELRRRFSRFGTINGVEIKLRQGSPDSKGDNGFPTKMFAYIDMDSSDKDFHRCINTYNKTKWKGSELKLQPAKENFMDRLQKERDIAELEAAGSDPTEVDVATQPHSHLDDVAGVYNYHMRGAKPGTAIPGEKNWIVGKYGSVLPVMHMKSKDRRKIMTVDPSKFTHNVKRMKEENTIKEEVAPDSLTWKLEDQSTEMTKLRQGHFPDWKPIKKQKCQPPVQVSVDSDMEEVPQSETINYSDSAHHLSGVINGQTDMSRFDSDSETEEQNSGIVLPVENRKRKTPTNASNNKSCSKVLKQIKHKRVSESGDSTDTDEVVSVCKKKQNIANNKQKIESVSEGSIKLQKFKGTMFLKDSPRLSKITNSSGKQQPLRPFKGTSNLDDNVKKVSETAMSEKQRNENERQYIRKQTTVDAVQAQSKASHINPSTKKPHLQAHKQSTLVGISLTSEFSSGLENESLMQKHGRSVKGNLNINVDDDNSDFETLVKIEVSKVDKSQKINIEKEADNLISLKSVVGSENKSVIQSGDSDNDFEAIVQPEMKNYIESTPSISVQASGTHAISGKPGNTMSSEQDGDADSSNISDGTHTSESDSDSDSSSNEVKGVSDVLNNRKKPSNNVTDELESESSSDGSDSESESSTSDENTVNTNHGNVQSVAHASESDSSTSLSDSACDSSSSALPDSKIDSKTDVKRTTQIHDSSSDSSSNSEDMASSENDSSSDIESIVRKAVTRGIANLKSSTPIVPESKAAVPPVSEDGKSRTVRKVTEVTTSESWENVDKKPSNNLTVKLDSESSSDTPDTSDSESESSTSDESTVNANHGNVQSVAHASESESSSDVSDSESESSTSDESTVNTNHGNVQSVAHASASESSSDVSDSESESSTSDESTVNTNHGNVQSVAHASESESSSDVSDSESESSTSDESTVNTNHGNVQSVAHASESESSSDVSDSESESSTSDESTVNTNHGNVQSVAHASDSDSSTNSSDSDSDSSSSALPDSELHTNKDVKKTTQIHNSSSDSSSNSEGMSSSEDDSSSDIECIVKKEVTRNIANLKSSTAIIPESKAAFKSVSDGDKANTGGKVTRVNQPESREDVDKKRQGSVLQRQREVMAQKSAVQKALANLDGDQTPNKKIVFESDDDDEASSTAATVKTSQASSTTNGHRESVGKKRKSTLFASLSSSEEDSSDDDRDQDRFKLRPEFEGATGKKLMKLQSRYGNDERFKLDSRFMESDDERDELIEAAAPTEDSELDRSLKILQTVVGDTSAITLPKDDRARKTFKDSLHFDPTKVEHSQFEVKVKPKPQASKQDKKKRKLEGTGEPEEMEDTLPTVSKERFYEVSDSIKNVFTHKPTEDEGQSGGFSLLAAFGRKADDSDDEYDETAYSTSTPMTVPASHMSVDNRFRVDSSDSEASVHDGDIADTNRDKVKEVIVPPAVAMETKCTTFFFVEGDARLKEGETFYCKEDAATVRDKWTKHRPQLIESYKAKQKIARRKAKTAPSRNTPSKRGGKRPRFH